MRLVFQAPGRTAGECAIDPAWAGEFHSFSFRGTRAFAGTLLRYWSASMRPSQRLPAKTRGTWEDSVLTNHATAVRTRSPKVMPLTSSPIRVSGDTISRMTAVFKLLADPSRLKIVLALAQDSELHVSALCDMLGQSQPAVSHHLTLMRMVGLVGFRR